MAVFRVERTRDYTVMSNYHLKDTGLTLKAKGLLSMMLSLPDEWNYTTRGLASICKESFIHYIAPISRALSFILLVLIGLNMLRETLKENSETNSASIAPTVMIPAAIATSIDAFAVGVTFAALQVNMIVAVSLIGSTAFLLSSVGVKIGNIFGNRMEKWAGILGGFILIAIGVKILVAG